MESFLSYSLMTNLTSRIRTGNIFLDTCIGLIIAAIVSKILLTSKNESSNLWNKIITRLKSLFGFRTYIVTIRHDSSDPKSPYGHYKQDNQYILIANHITSSYRDKVEHIHRFWDASSNTSNTYHEYKTATFTSTIPSNTVHVPYQGHILKVEFTTKEETVVTEDKKGTKTNITKMIQISSKVSQSLIFQWLDEIWNSEVEKVYKPLDISTLHYYVLGRNGKVHGFWDYNYSSRRNFPIVSSSIKRPPFCHM